MAINILRAIHKAASHKKAERPALDTLEMEAFRKGDDLMNPRLVCKEVERKTADATYYKDVFNFLWSRVTCARGDPRVGEWFKETQGILGRSLAQIGSNLRSLARKLLYFHVVLEIDLSDEMRKDVPLFITSGGELVKIVIDDMLVLPVDSSVRSRFSDTTLESLNVAVAYLPNGTKNVRRNTHEAHFTPLVRDSEPVTALDLIQERLERAFVIPVSRDRTRCAVCGTRVAENPSCARFGVYMESVRNALLPKKNAPSQHLSAKPARGRAKAGSSLRDLRGRTPSVEAKEKEENEVEFKVRMPSGKEDLKKRSRSADPACRE
jgi:hypothetical protein